MTIHVEPDPLQLAASAAAFVAREARRAIATRQRFTLALSGGTAPRRMFEALAREELRWDSVHVFQVDERVAPEDSGARNLTVLRTALLDPVAIPGDQVHPMPVERDDLEAAAADYAATLGHVLGPDRLLDLVHLGIGEDGHTASLLPGDPSPESGAPVIVSMPYQGFRRLSLNYAVLSAARQRLWFVTGAAKSEVLARAVDGDPAVPAGRIERRNTHFFVDRSAAAGLED